MSFGNGHVFSIVQHQEFGTDYYHFATKLGNVGMNAKYLSLIPNLKLFINHFKDKISQQRELSLAYQLRIPLQKASGEFQVMEPSVDIEAFNNLIKTNRHYLAGHHQYLTDRERECMVWLAVGKTYDEIAIILGITPRTVKAHVSSIKEKTNSQTQFQLGALWSKYS
jgi:DNA-binding CsgD family transcriptional regulator